MDNRSKLSRSRLMAAVKSRGNLSTEMKVADFLRKDHLHGWRRHYPIKGTPDFSWPRLKIALFVDGCFWHGCPRCHKLPKSNIRFWKEKVVNNRRRDRKVNAILRRAGWKVIRIWECRIREERTLIRIKKSIYLRKGTILH